MLVEIQVNKTKQEVYAMDENYNVIATFPCSTDFYPGYNEYGQPYCNAEDGTYENIYIEAKGPEADEPPYGWAYIDLGDGRGHALHGGGSILDDPFAAVQEELVPTQGCFRMYNIDVYWLAQQAMASNYNVVITVVSEE